MAGGDPGRTAWTDERISDRVLATDRQLQSLEAQLKVLGSLGTQVATLTALVESVREDAREAKEEAKRAREMSEKSRKDMLVAVLGFAGPVTVAIIGGIITLILGGAGSG